MRLTYWVSQCTNDSDAYSIRRQTRREVLEEINNRDPNDYDKPKKVTSPEVRSTFELVEMCLSEGRAYWEN